MNQIRNLNGYTEELICTIYVPDSFFFCLNLVYSAQLSSYFLFRLGSVGFSALALALSAAAFLCLFFPFSVATRRHARLP